MTTLLGDDIVATVEQDTVVTVHYTGTFVDTGQEFDSSEGGEPLGFLVGHGNMIQGFEQELLGASEGDTREFTLTPDRAYGHREEDAIQDVPRSQFPDEIDVEQALEDGYPLAAHDEQGRPRQFKISAIEGDIVKIDFNHPMAGRTLHFSVNVVSVRDALPEELEHGHAHGPGHHHH